MTIDKINLVKMTDDEIKKGLIKGWQQCIVEAQNDGTICWDEDDSKEREPVHSVKKGDLFWCWNFKIQKETTYTHDYGNMGPTDKIIKTNVKLKLVYITDNIDDPNLYKTLMDKSPNIT